MQPRIVVVMGERALATLNDLELPLARRIEPRLGEVQRLTPTVEALYVPDIDGAKHALAASTWRSATGELVGLLGPNGAGQVDAGQDRLRARPPDDGHGRGVRRPGGLAEARARSATWPSCSASRAGACADEVLDAAPAAGRAPTAAPRERAELLELVGLADGARPPRRGDVEGHAAAARHRPGAGRRPAAAAARRADERARPGRPAHRARAAGRAARAAASRCCSTRTCSARSSWSATASRSSTAGASSPPARPSSWRGRAASRSRPAAACGASDGAGREDVPRIVAELVAAGERVYGVRVLALDARGRLPRGGRRDAR